MVYKGTLRLRLSAAAVAVCVLAPAAARADFTALSSPDQISGTLFTFDSLDVGFVTSATNAATRPYGFTFPDAELDTLAGEYVASASDGGRVVDVLGDILGFPGLVRFRFEDLVQAAGVDYDTGTTLSLLAYDNEGNLINPDESILAPAGSRGFFGIAADVGIREVLIHNHVNTFQLDNLRFGAAVAPVPGAWALGAFGLVLVGLVRRKT